MNPKEFSRHFWAGVRPRVRWVISHKDSRIEVWKIVGARGVSHHEVVREVDDTWYNRVIVRVFYGWRRKK